MESLEHNLDIVEDFVHGGVLAIQHFPPNYLQIDSVFPRIQLLYVLRQVKFLSENYSRLHALELIQNLGAFLERLGTLNILLHRLESFAALRWVLRLLWRHFRSVLAEGPWARVLFNVAQILNFVGLLLALRPTLSRAEHLFFRIDFGLESVRKTSRSGHEIVE